MIRLYCFKENRAQSIASLDYTETFSTTEEAMNRVRQFNATNYIITDTNNKPNLPLR